MLDMQNVKDIEIPEGNVRTIQDKDNRLIWGRLAYDTKYAGDTEQQTYSGKNLMNISTGTTSGGITSTWANNVVTLSGKTSSTYSNISATDQMNFEAGETYTISILQPTNLFRVQIRVNYDGTNHGFTIDKNGTNVTFSIPSGAASPKLRIMYIDGFSADLDINGTLSFQIEKGSTATAYEPYVGGIPAPNPDYPQDIDVVTGTQTVTISDGANSEDFTISLGTIELCKIGDYQDYIYKSGEDWYVHKTTGNVVLDGSNDEGWIVSSYDRIRTSSTFGLSNNGSSYVCYANQLINANSETVENSFNVGNAAIYIKCISKTSSVANWKTWLSSNNLIIYGVLATPTDTKITDATLVGQLNAVHEWLTRYGYNATVTGNLPIIINKTNL